jgi:hypothetical protein
VVLVMVLHGRIQLSGMLVGRKGAVRRGMHYERGKLAAGRLETWEWGCLVTIRTVLLYTAAAAASGAAAAVAAAAAAVYSRAFVPTQPAGTKIRLL